jgi:hypothetical protein
LSKFSRLPENERLFYLALVQSSTICWRDFSLVQSIVQEQREILAEMAQTAQQYQKAMTQYEE